MQVPKSEVTYLGHVVSEEGIQTDPEKLEAIRTWPVPQNVKEVRSYLSFFKDIIGDSSRIMLVLQGH